VKSDPRKFPAQSSPKPELTGSMDPFFPSGGRFPREIASGLIEENTGAHDILLDPFSVCGTTAVEALRTGRRAALVELNPVSAFLAEVLLRPISLPLLHWAFEDVRGACRERISAWYATACPECGTRGVIDAVIRKNGKIIRIEYACGCSSRKLAKAPDADDLRMDGGIPRLEIPDWYPQSLPLPAASDAILRYPSDFLSRRTTAALAAILQAIENTAPASTRDALKAAFASSLEACHPRGQPSPVNSALRRRITPREENPWRLFETAFQRLYGAKKETNRLLKNAAVGRMFAELGSGRANIILLPRTGKDSTDTGLPDSSVDYAVTAVPFPPPAPSLPSTAIQAAWLKLDLDYARDIVPEFPEPVHLRNERMISVFRLLRRAGKEGSGVQIFYGGGGDGLHGLLNLMEKSGLDAESIRHRPVSDPRGFSGGYVLEAEVRKIRAASPGGVQEAALRKKLAAAARDSLALHGSKNAADRILRAFYQQLGADEIASVSKYSIRDLLAKAVESFAAYRGDRLVPRKGKLQAGAARRKTAAWRRTALDAESAAGGGRDAAQTARDLVIRRLAREGLTEEDALAVRAGLRRTEIERHRRERTAGLLLAWGKALGHSCRKQNAPAGIQWKTPAGGSIAFVFGKQSLRVTTRPLDRSAVEWGSLSYLDLERQLREWCQDHPGSPAAFSENLIPLEDLSKTWETERQGSSPTRDLKLKVLKNRRICERHYLMSAELPADAALEFTPGQFFHVVCDPGAEVERPYPLTLRRPLSIHRVLYPGFDRCALAGADDLPGEIRRALKRHPSRIDFLYRVVGAGTDILSRIPAGAVLDAIGPCGTGFSIGEESSAVIVAGGIGIAPLAALAEQLRHAGREVLVYLGAVEKEMLRLAVTGGAGGREESGERDLLEAIEAEFREIGAQILTVCTDDGSLGEKGLVTEMFEQGIRSGCVPRESVCIYACGPEGMLRSVAAIAARHGLDCQVSLEERMACGIGACYSCTATVRLPDGSTRKQRVCREGPVFHARDIVWKD
jgi:dihydroorotate dehydrogenase electron transfer subunit